MVDCDLVGLKYIRTVMAHSLLNRIDGLEVKELSYRSDDISGNSPVILIELLYKASGVESRVSVEVLKLGMTLYSKDFTCNNTSFLISRDDLSYIVDVLVYTARSIHKFLVSNRVIVNSVYFLKSQELNPTCEDVVGIDIDGFVLTFNGDGEELKGKFPTGVNFYSLQKNEGIYIVRFFTSNGVVTELECTLRSCEIVPITEGILYPRELKSLLQYLTYIVLSYRKYRSLEITRLVVYDDTVLFESDVLKGGTV